MTRILCHASSLLPVKSSGRLAFKSTWTVIVDISLLSFVSDSDSQSEELGLKGGGGESGRKGKGREVGECYS